MKKAPPYLSYRTFKNFLDSLRATAIPTRIDRGIMANMSGSNQALLISTVRYLGLASEHGVPTADLKRLIEAKESDRNQVWSHILMNGYRELFDSNLDLERTTTNELANVFRRQGVTSPDRIRKCVSFFTLAAKDAGIKLSPHIKPYVGKRKEPRRPRSDGNEKFLNERTELSDESTAPPEWQLLLSKFPDFDPGWPEDLRKNWIEGFESLSRIIKLQKKSTNSDRDLT